MHLDFSGILVIALVVTGGIWALDAKLWAKNRFSEDDLPILVEYARSFFPVILIVLVLRSFFLSHSVSPPARCAPRW